VHTKSYIIKQYNEDNATEFDNVISTHRVPKEFTTIPIQTLVNGKNVFFLFEEYEIKIWFVRFTRVEIIGYCIVEDVYELPKSFKNYWKLMYNIPEYVLKENPVVISDFMIARIYRRRGFGKRLATYILDEKYNGKNIALHAEDDGINFWPKMGFERVEGAGTTMTLKGGKCNA